MGMEQIGALIGVTLAVLIFISYMLGDNPLYRMLLGLLVGAATGYALGMAVRFVLLPWLEQLFDADGQVQIYNALGLLLGALLLLKGIPRWAHLANIPMGLLLGVGAAVAVSGALLGTLLPQIQATGMGLTFRNGLFGFADGVLGLIGTLLTLLVFSPFPGRAESDPPPIFVWLQRAGRAFIIVALAVTFAGALTSALTVLIERGWLIKEAIQQLLVGG